MTDWQRSSYCSGGTCIETARDGDRVLMRDSKNPTVQPLDLSAGDWKGFLEAVRAGDYES